ncbi:MAG: homocysteine S-methyltransferase family protein [Clostridia bacterium]|nr:homocysteine S-methyltransferase family protein [Clostridia bacterium]
MNRPVLLDGAVGTTLWHLADAAGVKREPVWKYNIEHPELVSELHRRYVEAGTQIMLTNTFGANRQMVTRSSPYKVSDVVRSGVKLAKEAVKGTNVKLAAACGPLKDFMEPYGDLEEEEVEDMFTELIGSAVDEGVDMVMVQTFLDLDSALVACRVAKKLNMPLFCTLTFEKTGKTLMGNSVEKVCKALEDVGADCVGMNCSLGPNMALPIISEFRKHTKLPLVFKPNAGLPITSTTGNTTAPYTAEMFVEEVRPAFDFVSYIGGCCNTDDEYVRLLARALEER